MYVLFDVGVSKGDVVVLLFDDKDWVDYVVVYIGVYKVGVVIVYMNFWYFMVEFDCCIE